MVEGRKFDNTSYSVAKKFLLNTLSESNLKNQQDKKGLCRYLNYSFIRRDVFPVQLLHILKSNKWWHEVPIYSIYTQLVCVKLVYISMLLNLRLTSNWFSKYLSSKSMTVEQLYITIYIYSGSKFYLIHVLLKTRDSWVLNIFTNYI